MLLVMVAILHHTATTTAGESQGGWAATDDRAQLTREKEQVCTSLAAVLFMYFMSYFILMHRLISRLSPIDPIFTY